MMTLQPNQNMFATRAGLAAPTSTSMPVQPPQQLQAPPQIAPEGPGMVPPGMVPPGMVPPGGMPMRPVSGAVPGNMAWRPMMPGMPGPGAAPGAGPGPMPPQMAAQNFMRQRMGLM